MLQETKDYLMKEFGIKENVIDFCNEMEKQINSRLKDIDDVREYNQLKVLKALQNVGLSDRHFSVSTGYGYDDIGRDALERAYAEVFGTEDALVRPQIISGTHALSLCLYGLLRPTDEMLSITGKPYDTLESVIGINDIENGQGSLRDYNIHYRQVNLTSEGEIDISKVMESISPNTKMVYIQRSTGYDWRRALNVDRIKDAVAEIRTQYPEILIMVDNCYGEFLEPVEPTQVGVDIMAGSLIKNPGGGLAPTGGYIVGKQSLIDLVANRLSAPGLGKEGGATLGINRTFFQGLFLAPHIVAEAVKVAVMAAKVFEELGFEVCPTPEDKRSDIIQSIKFGTAEGVIAFCKAIQESAPVDAFVTPEPWDMPGYNDPVIMAAGAFIQGSSIELSADGPVKPPYIAYLQGGLTFDHGKTGIYIALERLKQKNIITL